MISSMSFTKPAAASDDIDFFYFVPNKVIQKIVILSDVLDVKICIKRYIKAIRSGKSLHFVSCRKALFTRKKQFQ